MSYTEFLRRKMAAEIKVVDTRENTDASMHTTKVRMAASQDFAIDGGRYGSINSPTEMSMDPLRQVNSYKKQAGGRVPDASYYTSFRGGQSIGGTTQAGLKPAQVNVGTCYVIAPTVPPLNASDWTRTRLGCKQALGEQHDPATVGPNLFVDNTIRNQGDPALCTSRPANHTAPAVSPHAIFPNRPVLADKGNLQPGKELGAVGGNPNYKAGAALRKIPKVYKHQGNDSNVNPRQLIKRYQIPAGTPAHLRINDPFQTGGNKV